MVIAARKKRLEQAAALGLIFLPIFMFPANYYLHVVMLMPLVAIDWRSLAWQKRKDPAAVAELAGRRPFDAADAWAVFSLLSICAVQYFTTFITEFRLHFYLSSVVLMGGLAFMLGALARRDGAALLAALPFRKPLDATAGAAVPAEPLPEPAAAKSDEPAPSTPKPAPGDAPEPTSERPAAVEAE
jgi:hypothetical protein